MNAPLISQDWVTLVPAYGRDYKTKALAEADFRLGKAFELATPGFGGKYYSIRDFKAGTKVVLRFHRLQRTTAIEI